MSELAYKAKTKILHPHALDSTSSSSSSSSSASSSSSVGIYKKNHQQAAEWVLSKGKYIRDGIGEEEDQVRELLGPILGSVERKNKIKHSGNYYFPPNGYKSWSKNALASSEGWRLYLVHNVPTDKSSFRYRHPTTGLVRIMYMYIYASSPISSSWKLIIHI